MTEQSPRTYSYEIMEQVFSEAGTDRDLWLHDDAIDRAWLDHAPYTRFLPHGHGSMVMFAQYMPKETSTN